MVACQEVLPYVPAAALVRAQAADVAAADDGSHHHIDFTRELSCAGDFAHPLLNQDLRRFLMRDVLSLLLSVLAVVSFAISTYVAVTTPSLLLPATVVSTILAFSIIAIATIADAAAYFLGDQSKAWPSAMRNAATVATAVGYVIFSVQTAFWPSQGLIICTTEPAASANGTAAATAEGHSRERDCFERVNPYFGTLIFGLFVMRRMYPQHGVPVLLAMLIGYSVSLLLYKPDPFYYYGVYDGAATGTIVTDVLMTCCDVIAGAVFCVRFHGLSRDRFIATVEAERARLQSIAEMREVDSVLQRALPPAVLERMMAAGVEIRDATESASVVIADVAGLTAYAQFVGQLAAVHALHAFVSEADAAVAGVPGVEKIKTAGDSYCVVSGLPEAIDCHASAACRSGRALVDAAARLSAAPPAPVDLRDNSVGECRTDNDHSADADDDDDDDERDAGEAVPVQPTAHEEGPAVTAAAGSGLDGWRGGALRLRVGIHSGSALGGVLGTQRLCYEVYGDALDGARVAASHAPPNRISITDAARRRLAIEAALYAARTDSAALFATHSDVHDATEQLDDVDSGAMVLYELMTTTTETSIGSRFGSVLVRARASHADAASVATHSVVSGFVGKGSDVGGWTAGRMLAQRAGLEQRLEFILRLAREREQAARHPAQSAADAYAVQSTAAVESEAPRNPLQNPTSTDGATSVRKPHPANVNPARGESVQRVGSDDIGSPLTVATSEATSTEISTPSGPADAEDPEATKLLSMIEDAVNGPFRRGSCVPLLYRFADDDEERGYIEWVREHTHELRRDMRFAALVLYAVVLGCYVGIGQSEDRSAVAIGCFAASILLGVVNLGLTATGKAPRADEPLSYATFLVMAAGVFAGNATEAQHVITNDVFWLSTVFILFVDVPAVTLSPLARSAVDAVVIVAVLLPLGIAGHNSNEYGHHVMLGVYGVVTQPYRRYLFDKLLRSAFIETRVAALLRLQQDDARRAREVMLQGVVPPHSVRPLQRWLQAGTPEPLAEEHAAMVVCHVSLRGFTAESGEVAGPGLSLLDAHRAVDAILDTCPHLTKVRMSGHSVTLAGPFPPAVAQDGLYCVSTSSYTDLKPQAWRLGAALCDALRVVAAVVQVGMVVDAGIDVGPVVGAVVGSRRLSYDVHGPCVDAAQRVAESLAGTAASTAVSGATVAVAMTDAACDVAAAASSPAVTDRRRGEAIGFALGTRIPAVDKGGRPRAVSVSVELASEATAIVTPGHPSAVDVRLVSRIDEAQLC